MPRRKPKGEPAGKPARMKAAGVALPKKGRKVPVPRTALMPVCPGVAAVLGEARRKMGLSFCEMERLTGVSRQMIRMVENLTCIPSLEILSRLAYCLRLPLACLMELAGKRDRLCQSR